MTLRAAPVLALLASLALGACASEAAAPPPPAWGPPPGYAPPPPLRPALPPLAAAPAPAPVARPLPPGLLPAPPANAGPGECFAKVVVPGEPLPMPPAAPHGVWVLTPGAPGAGPMWCLYIEPGAQPPPAFTPERSGWIRVLCDEQRSRAQVRRVQRRLHAWGYYHGAYDGRVDHATADGLRRFQARRRIPHGGYMSLETLRALDEAPQGAAPPPLPPAGPPALLAPPPCALPCAPPDQGRPPYSRWLGWSGKSVY